MITYLDKPKSKITYTDQEDTPISAMKPREAFGMDLPEDIKQKHPYLAATQETLKEGLAIPAIKFLDMASLGQISGGARRAGEVLPEPKTGAGKALSVFASLGGLVKSPVLKGIGKIKVPVVEKALEAKKITRPLAGAATGAVRGATAGFATSPGEIEDIPTRAKQAVFGGAAGAAIGAGIGTVQSMLANRPEKVNQIRQGMKKWWKDTSKEYGKLMKQAGVEGGEIDPVDTLDLMEKELVTKGVIDRSGNLVAQGQDKVDRALYKAYDQLKTKFYVSSGKVPAKEVIGAARTVKAAGQRASKFKPTAMGSEARRLESGIEETFKANVADRGKSLEEANRLWSNMRGKFDIVNKHFDTWESNLATGKGERSLSKIMSSGEMRNVARIIEEQTGVNLTADRIISVITSPAIRNTARTLGIIGAIVYGLKGGRGNTPMTSTP
jgi:hypothetical protein